MIFWETTTKVVEWVILIRAKNWYDFNRKCLVEELKKLNHVVTEKRFLTKVIIMTLDIKQSAIAKELKISQGQVSKLIAGERTNPKFNKWIIKQLTEKYYEA